MATTKNTYTGNGSTTNYAFTFPYIKQADVKVSVDNVATTAFTFANATTVSFNTAPANGAEIVIYLDEWYNIESTTIADTYLANDVALSSSSVFSVPIHQRTDNFQLRIFNDSPFPVSLNSMMWEGHYSPRFYRRQF